MNFFLKFDAPKYFCHYVLYEWPYVLHALPLTGLCGQLFWPNKVTVDKASTIQQWLILSQDSQKMSKTTKHPLLDPQYLVTQNILLQIQLNDHIYKLQCQTWKKRKPVEKLRI